MSRATRSRAPAGLPDALHHARVERDHQRLIEAAASALHTDPRATIAASAATAGLSALTANRLFAGRTELAVAVRSRALDELERAPDRSDLGTSSALDALRRMTHHVLTSAPTRALLPQAVWLIDVDPVAQQRWPTLTATSDAVLNRAQAGGELRRDVTLDGARKAIRGLLAKAVKAAATGAVSVADASASATRALVSAA